MDKRNFIKTLGLGALTLPLKSIGADSIPNTSNTFEMDSWEDIRKQYDLPDFINFENGFYNIIPRPVVEAQIRYLKQLNLEGSHYMRTRMDADSVRHRQTLADFLGVETEEVIITRNTTESLNAIICGTQWSAGDEVILANQEYPAMVDMLRQQSARFGIVNQLIDIPLHPQNDEEIVDLYRRQITRKTKLILISHMINTSGHILPVRQVCDMAHERGVKVLVDGAHAIGHFNFKISDLNCDYYGSSLHKWLSVPLGAGMLYIKKGNVKDLWPLFADSNYDPSDIRKMNHTGTGPLHVQMCIPDSINFIQQIGQDKKETRLREIKQTIVAGLNQNYRVNTPADLKRSCGIVNIAHQQLSPQTLAERLMKEHNLYTVAVNYAGIKGIRITPNVYTSLEETKRLVTALNAL